MPVFAHDRTLLLAFRNGDAEALAKVYWHYVADVERACRFGFRGGTVRIPGCLGPEDVAEMVQETFARAFTEAARQAFDGIRPYRPYLLRIVRNLMVDRARSRGRIDATTEFDERHEFEIDDAEPVEDSVLLRDLQRATKAFLSTLDSDARAFVRLRFEEERSQDEVAATLGMTRRRVRTLESLIRNRLLTHLEQEGLRAAFSAVVRGEISGITRPKPPSAT